MTSFSGRWRQRGADTLSSVISGCLGEGGGRGGIIYHLLSLAVSLLFLLLFFLFLPPLHHLRGSHPCLYSMSSSSSCFSYAIFPLSFPSYYSSSSLSSPSSVQASPSHICFLSSLLPLPFFFLLYFPFPPYLIFFISSFSFIAK